MPPAQSLCGPQFHEFMITAWLRTLTVLLCWQDFIRSVLQGGTKRPSVWAGNWFLTRSRDRIHDERVGYSPPTPPSRMRPLNKEGAVGVMRRVPNTRLAVKRRVVFPAVMDLLQGPQELSSSLLGRFLVPLS